MKKICIILVLIFGFTINSQVQQLENDGGVHLPDDSENTSAFKIGEWLKFRIHYGFLNASYATLQVKSHNLDGIPVYHVVGNGKTTGFASIFFKVDDTYESYFDKSDGRPYKFIRKIDEGGYTKDIEVNFDHKKDIAVLNDKKNDKKFNFTIQEGIQDLVSAFYFLRNNYKVEDLVEGESINLNLLYDDDGVFKFKLKYMGVEVLRTKYGKVECLKFRPYVQSGRVFKEQESLSLWVSNDGNRIPVRIQADLSVGSIKADLDGYNGLKHQFKIIMD
ncbi:DUF3108 domain-containing protein [Arenibacter sp. TNZ]|jgi:hypothetical protein|uniref:DUF3108 domain-containing protein n=1 Tax=Arenibacter TaxID=178469 RepID=UPI000CD42DCF|nr:MULTISPECIES: DUF3108 domain-containing protein [Arenibacter]MCM4171216.1 DUF3108 domain-containing protein [Arenibacter sp. TNZ]